MLHLLSLSLLRLHPQQDAGEIPPECTFPIIGCLSCCSCCALALIGGIIFGVYECRRRSIAEKSLRVEELKFEIDEMKGGGI